MTDVPNDLVRIRDTNDGIQWIGRRVDVYIEGCGAPLHRCFSDGIVAHCIRAHDGGPRVVVLSARLGQIESSSAGSYGSPFKVYLREIGSVRFELSDDLPEHPPFRP